MFKVKENSGTPLENWFESDQLWKATTKNKPKCGKEIKTIVSITVAKQKMQMKCDELMMWWWNDMLRIVGQLWYWCILTRQLRGSHISIEYKYKYSNYNYTQ